MKSKLLKAVEQTVNRYYNRLLVPYDYLSCGFCSHFQDDDCSKCPIYKLEEECCDSSNVAYPGTLHYTWNNGMGGDIESCLAIMVYVWGFINFGEEFDK